MTKNKTANTQTQAPSDDVFKRKFDAKIARIRNLPVQFYKSEGVNMEDHSTYMESEVREMYLWALDAIEEAKKQAYVEVFKFVEAILLFPYEGHLISGKDKTRAQIIGYMRNDFNKLKLKFMGRN